MRVREWAHRRSHHGRRRDEIHRQRRTALIMIGTGTFQAAVWGLLLVLGLGGVPFASRLLASVRFISEISLWALVLACWAQVAASLAQLTAGDVHHDVHQTRDALAVDVDAIESDIAQLADLHPGADGRELADSICRRLRP